MWGVCDKEGSGHMCWVWGVPVAQLSRQVGAMSLADSELAVRYLTNKRLCVIYV